ncbi:heme ABC transporter ATP-binding protein [Catenulispora yoronensis]|uniref:Heme ABC transporter ATP-binding protein n=1 Tax=Catenulispora yoronensis TaxID=450799 RepID=A0ABN2TKC3_9ACTN
MMGRRPEPPIRRPPGALIAEAQAVHLARGGRTVLDCVDLPVRAGSLLALLGPNGAGKSTLLAALSGDLSPNSGRVLLHGRPLHDYRAQDLALQRAMLPQSSPVSFPFSAVEVVRMGRAPWARHATLDEDERAVTEALTATDTHHLADRPYPALSGGERARIALARVLAQQTQLLLLDEPTAALDLRHQELVLRTARTRASAGDAVVMVLHDLSLAAAYADVIALLHQGRILAQGRPEEVLEASTLSAVYGCPVDVFSHPTHGTPMVVPVRERKV